MTTGMRARVRAMCVALAALAAVTPSVAAAALTQSWNGWRWARSDALVIQVGNNFSSDWSPFVTTAITQWNAATNIDYSLVAGRTSAATCGAVYGTIQLCSGNYGKSGYLGYTYVWTSNNYIVQATIKLNTYYFNQAKYNTDAWKAETVCQELGNALGLADIDRNFSNLNVGSCTDYTNDPSGKLGTNGVLANIAPSANDLTNLNAIYATTGGTQLATTRPGGGGNAMAAVPEPASWAMLVTGFGAIGAAQRRRKAMVAA